MNRALGRQLQQDRLAGLLNEIGREAGPVDPHVLDEVRREWPAPDTAEARRSDRPLAR